jgi:hypothetical protein
VCEVDEDERRRAATPRCWPGRRSARPTSTLPAPCAIRRAVRLSRPRSSVVFCRSPRTCRPRLPRGIRSGNSRALLAACRTPRAPAAPRPFRWRPCTQADARFGDRVAGHARRDESSRRTRWSRRSPETGYPIPLVSPWVVLATLLMSQVGPATLSGWG